MIRKYHNHTLQTNPLHHEEKPQNTNIHKNEEDNSSKATSVLFLVKMIAKLERKQRYAYQNKDQT